VLRGGQLDQQMKNVTIAGPSKRKQKNGIRGNAGDRENRPKGDLWAKPWRPLHLNRRTKTGGAQAEEEKTWWPSAMHKARPPNSILQRRRKRHKMSTVHILPRRRFFKGGWGEPRTLARKKETRKQGVRRSYPTGTAGRKGGFIPTGK